MTTRVSNQFDKPEQFEELLTAAENADPRGDAADFVAELRAKYDRYGQSMFLSDKQKRWLENIAGALA